MSVEKAIEAYGAKVAKAHGGWPIKLAMLGGRGWPDHTVIMHGGRIIFIEYKRPGGAFQPLQKLMHRKLGEFGFEVHVVESKAHVDRIFNGKAKD